MSQLGEWKNCRVVGGRGCVPGTAPSLPTLFSTRARHEVVNTGDLVVVVGSKPVNFAVMCPVKGVS